MKFIINEGGRIHFNYEAYHGVIGIFYDSTWSGVLTYLIFGLICIFTIIGIIATLKFVLTKLLFGKKKTEVKDSGKVWLKTGKWPD